MELRVLEYYLMVAREENITKAAELLHITQPTLSRQLAQMEEELGVKLFHRGKRSISLTDEGLLLKRRAQELVDLANKTREELQSEDGELSGTIAIGSGETKSIHMLTDLMTEFRSRYPKVKFELYSATSDYIKERLDVVGTYNLLYNGAVFAESINGAILCMENDYAFERLTFVPLEPGLETGSVLVWKKNQFHSTAVARFMEHVRLAEKEWRSVS